MNKFDLGRQFAAIVCTAVFSSIFVLGAVAPAQVAGPAPTHPTPTHIVA